MEANQTKNDGTDPKKNADSVGTEMSTTRSCSMQVVNNLGQTITDVIFTHGSGGNTDVINVPFMNNGDKSDLKQISYETGFNADFDYWSINFSFSDGSYSTPYNDRCNIEASDAGQTIQGIINADINYGGAYNLEVRMPVSSNCNFDITQD